jgi:hypothetical protein
MQAPEETGQVRRRYLAPHFSSSDPFLLRLGSGQPVISSKGIAMIADLLPAAALVAGGA